MSFFSSTLNRLNRKNSMWVSIRLFVFLLFSSFTLQAEPVFQFHALDKRHGLASSVVYDIAEDSDGFVWFATEDGLQKYDGFEFVSYRHSRKDDNSLANNIVRSLLVDDEGRLWVGTDNGLNIYRKEYNDFVRIGGSKTDVEGNYVEDSNDSRGLSSNRIRDLYQTSDGVIWIGTTKGLSSLDPRSLKFNNFDHSKVRSILEDDHKQIWVGTLESGLHLFDRNTFKFKPVNRIIGTDKNDSLRLTSLENESIIDIYSDSYGRILIATWGQGVFRLNRDSHRLEQYHLNLPSEYVRTIHQDESGRIWFGTADGIIIQDTVENKARIINSKNKNLISTNVDNVSKIFQSMDETIWIGMGGGGLSRHFPLSRKFESFGIHNNTSLGIPDPVVFSLSENTDGNIWVGSESGKLSLFNSVSERFTHYPLILDNQQFTASISDIYQISEDLLLVGTGYGLFKYWLKTGVLEMYKSDLSPFNRVGEPVKSIESDSYGRIWVVFTRTGISAFEVKNSEIKQIEKYNINISAPQALVIDSRDKLLIGTEGLGIVEVLFKDAKVEKNIVPGSKGANILWMTRDWNGDLWSATASQGIKFFSQNGGVIGIGEEEGLPNNTVYSILSDVASQRIWATTNLGMVSIDPMTFTIERYGFYDGLQGDEFNRAGLRTLNGYIYFGGMNGFNRFFPNIIKNKLFIQKPKITGLRVANGELQAPSNSKSLLVSKKINLNFDQTPFSIEFTSPQFVKPSNIEFRYRLLGLDDKWITAAKDSRRATYTNIPHGGYVFELQARDINSSWGEYVERKNIVIHPSIWLSGIAKLIYFLVIFSIFATFMYLNWKRRQADRLTQRTITESEERLRLSLWASGNEIWDWNIRSGEVLRSDTDKNIEINCSKLSRNLKELSGYIHKYDVDRVKRELNKHLSGKSGFFDCAYRIKDEKLKWRWIQDRAKVVERDEDNKPIRMSGTQKDVSEIHRKDEEIERLGQAFRTTSDGVWIRDAQWRLIECNPSYEKITGFSFEEKEGEELWFPDVSEQPVNVIQRIRLSLMEKGNWQGEVWAERKGESPFPQKLSVDTILDEKGYVRYYVGVFSDITFHKRSEEEFRRLANFDSLTGLPNRACLYDRLNQTIEKTRIRRERFALFVVDIDNFKRVNDSLGHSVGDTLISEVALRLTKCNRDGDTIARIGGDEFVIIRDSIQSSTEVASFAELMLSELNLPVYIKGQKLNLNFSIGITISPGDGIVAEKLLRNADTAMYEAKKEVLNSYHFYSAELNDKARKKLSMENELRSAIEQDSIDLMYQPKVDLKTGEVCGIEALARWTHPKLGSVSPIEFIELAEETGLILDMGRKLLQKAVRQTKKWVDEGVMRGRMSVNLSAHQFWQRDLIAEVDDVLIAEDLGAKYLELELTESACVKDVEETIEQMVGLRKLGVHLALDDFGTGYSSLSQLKELPLDTLKVDRSFIQNIQHNEQDGNIVRAIIDIANNLNLSVVIEGVENQEQCEYLWHSRANIIQGYFFSRPVSNLVMKDLLTKKWDRKNYLSHVSTNVTPLA